MGRMVLRVLGVMIGGYASAVAASLAMFRMDSVEELREILQADAVVGLALAGAVVLLGVPATGSLRRRYARTVLGAVLVGAIVPCGLAWSHLEQYRIRSMRPPRPGIDLMTPAGNTHHALDPSVADRIRQ